MPRSAPSMALRARPGSGVGAAMSCGGVPSPGVSRWRRSAIGWRAQRQPHGDVILHHLLALRHRRQMRRRLDDPLAVEVAGEKRQRVRRAAMRARPATAPRGGSGPARRRRRPRPAAPAARGGEPGAAPDILAPRDSRCRAPRRSRRASSSRIALDLAEPQPQRQPAAPVGLHHVVPVAGVDVRPGAPRPRARGRRGRSAPGRRSPSAASSAARRRRCRDGGA